jgi:broad specificity phosphatase PhoE
MIENPFHNLESSEKISWKNIKVFRVRHGNTPYNEQLKGVPDESEIDLTEQGIKEIEQAAENISQRLNKDEDIVCVIYSPRKRTRDSAQIIRKYLTDKSFTVWEDIKRREEQDRIRSTDILDSDFNPIYHDEPAYAPAFRELLLKIKHSVPAGTPLPV